MDYEEFYQPFKQKEKSVADNLKRQHTVLKSVSKNASKGDLKSLVKDLNTMDSLISEYKSYLEELRAQAEGFDGKGYMLNGEFARQMLSACHDMGVDVKGDYPTYEMFPFKVKINGGDQDIYINKRRLPCVRPQYLISDIKKNKERLMKENFNTAAFLAELADAYDKLAILDGKGASSASRNTKLLLKDIYKYITPMQRFRRDYELQNFAFDISRLYSSDIEFTRDHRRFILGPARNQSQNLRILDKNGMEQLLGTIEFFPKEEEPPGGPAANI